MILAYLFVLHFIADFIFQSREMGQKKSSEWRWLARHLLIQFSFFLFGLGFASLFTDHLTAQAIVLIPILNTLVHGIIDWNIWRLYKLSAGYRIKQQIYKDEEWSGERFAGIPSEEYMAKRMKEEATKWQYWNDHWFYTTIGFDQLLHALTIIFLVEIFL